VNEDKATVYHRLRRRAELLGMLAAGSVLLTLLLTGWTFSLRELGAVVGMIIGRGWEEPGTVVGYTIALMILLQAVELPFAFYQGFVLEHRYALSNERAGQWAIDQAKSAGIGIIFAVLGASTVYWTLRVSQSWWWAVSALIFAVAMIGLVQLAPVLLLPLFYTFKPLDRPALSARLLALASRARTCVVGIYEWALSAHTKKANAALTGVGRTRRILLSDTLLASYSDDEIEVVLAHELSHHVHHDLWRGIAFQAVLITIGFLAAHAAFAAWTTPLGLRGVDDPAGLPLLLLVAGVCSVLLTPISHALSRAHERRADRYALDMTRQPDAFISAMRRLGQQNLAEEFPSTVVRWLFYSHPPIRERVEAARLWRTAQSAGGGQAADVA
jgi:STE24 endopeptidase